MEAIQSYTMIYILISDVFCFFNSKVLSLEDQAVVSLWSHSLSSLEEAVLSLLESVLSNTGSTPQRMVQHVSQSLLVGSLVSGQGQL